MMLRTPSKQDGRGSGSKGETLQNTPSATASDTTGSSTPSPHQYGTMMENEQGQYVSPGSPSRSYSSASAFPSHQSAVSVVWQAYGVDADLYKDVLQVSPSASAREIRTAYFRRGKQVLNEPDDPPAGQGSDYGANAAAAADTAPSIASVSQRSKLQFRAVSGAYEILSDPDLREEYDTTGTVTANALAASPIKDRTVLMQRSRSEATPTRKKASRPSRPSRTRSKQGVRWSQTVEELVITNDCVSIASRQSWNCGGSLDSVDDEEDDGNASIASIETAASSVKETLRRLDESAETFTRQEFLDELEESVTSLLDAASRVIEDEVSSGFRGVYNSDDDNSSNNGGVGNKGKADKKSSVRRKLFPGKKKQADSSSEKSTDRSSSLGTILTIGGDKKSKETATSNSSLADSTNKKQTNATREAPVATAKIDVASNKENEDASSDFYLYLSTYICGVVQEMKGSLDHVGSMCADAASCVIQENELDSLVHMLRTEVDQKEELDYKNESPLGKTFETSGADSVASTLATEKQHGLEAAPISA